MGDDRGVASGHEIVEILDEHRAPEQVSTVEWTYSFPPVAVGKPRQLRLVRVTDGFSQLFEETSWFVPVV
mgnify:CR=1 FL=1